jgi:SAM-dependent methyltransferase
MSPLGSHVAGDPSLSGLERAYIRLVGPPEPALRIRTAHLLRALRGRSPRRIVDVGAGAGFASISMARRFRAATVVALDLSEEQVALGRMLAAESGVANVTFSLLDAGEYEPPEPVDVVVCADALEYVRDDGLLVSRIGTWLSPEGLFVLHCRGNPSAYRLRRFKSAPSDRDGRIRAGYSDAELGEFATLAGLRLVSLRPTFTAPAELGYELVEPELGVFRGRAARAIVVPLALGLSSLDRFGIGRGAGRLAVMAKP